MTEKTSYDTLEIDVHAEKAYLDYAVAVVKGRALPRVEDGEKPVQVRILYAMQDMGLTHTAKLRKCAAVVGEVLGKYHPHGDSSVYDALVRMAQPFTLRYPLIEGQGNFGSRDGDSAAAMRYTEARLMPAAQLLLSELGAGTVDFTPNYDGSWMEPSVLPARLPMLLLNGASGIAVGMACEFPSHNLREVAAAAVEVIENPDVTTDQLLNIIPGPDFATGAQLISSRAEILAAYESGRGNLRARAVWKKEELARGQWQIVITDLPYQVSATGVLLEVEVLTNPQVKTGKKTLDQQQVNLKTVSLNLLETVRDESGKDAGVRLVVVPRSSKQTPEETMAFLFANTNLETSVPVNNTCIGLDGGPRTKGLKELLTEWARFRFVTVRRRTQYELDKVTARLHLLEGRMAVYLNVDQVVAAIRDAEDPKADIMAKFGLTEIQAEDILEMRLRALARLEGFKLEKEVDDCRKEQSRLQILVSNPDALNKLIIKEIKADAEKYGDDRRTLIKAEARASASPAARVVPNEPVTIIVSKNMWVRARSGHDIDEATLTYKPGDEKLAVLKTRTTESVLFLDNNGRAYTVQASDIPVSGRGDGVPLTTLIEVKDGSFIRYCLADHPDQNYLFAGKDGYGFISPLKNMVARPKAGKAFLTLGDDEEPMRPVRITSTEDGFVACGSSEAKMLCFPVNEVKQLGGGKGVMLMGLDGSETLTGLSYFSEMPFNAKIELKEQIGEISFGKADLEKYLGRRARKGAVLPKKGLLRG